MPRSPAWPRPLYRRATARAATLGFVALLDDPRLDDALALAEEAVDDARTWSLLSIEPMVRGNDGGRLDEALSGRAALYLEARDPHEQHEVARCQKYALLSAELPDPATLSVLGALTTTLAALAAEGNLLLALDRVTARWWAPAELAALEPDRAFDVDEHAQVVVESVERAPGAGHLVRSRGLAKFARPDVGGRAPRRDASYISELVRDVARLLAEGEEVRPGDRLRIPDLPPVTLVPRSDDCLADAAPDHAPLYELRDLAPDGPGADLSALLRALKPKPRLKVLK
jgi:hypothetical protein